MKNIGIFLSLVLILLGCSKEDPSAKSPETAQRPGERPTDSGVTWKPRANASKAHAKPAEPFVPPFTNTLPRHLQWILKYPDARLLPGTIPALKPTDNPMLLSCYRQELQLTNKWALTMALSFIGDEEVVEEFKNTLLQTHADRVLTDNEETVMLLTVEGLGLLSREHDSAFQFLTNAIDPRFWLENVQWRVVMGERAMAGRALTSLSKSQRPEVDEILNRLRQEPYISNGQGGGWPLGEFVVDAAFRRDFMATRGFEDFKTAYDTGEIFSEFQAWADTPKGKEWQTWFKQWEKDHPKEAGLLPPP